MAHGDITHSPSAHQRERERGRGRRGGPVSHHFISYGLQSDYVTFVSEWVRDRWRWIGHRWKGRRGEGEEGDRWTENVTSRNHCGWRGGRSEGEDKLIHFNLIEWRRERRKARWEGGNKLRWINLHPFGSLLLSILPIDLFIQRWIQGFHSQLQKRSM